MQGASFINSYEFMPHGMFYLWQMDILWTTVISDVSTAIAYFSFTAAFIVFVKRRKELAYPWFFVLLGSVIFLASGSAHLISAITIWEPIYGILAVVKAVMAISSVIAGIAIWYSPPFYISLPSPYLLKSAIDVSIEKVKQIENCNHIFEKQIVRQANDLESSKQKIKNGIIDCNRIESELQQSEKVLNERTVEMNSLLDDKNAIVNNNLIGIVIVKERMIMWSNSAFLTMLGYQEDEIIEMPTQNLYRNSLDYKLVGKLYSNIADGIIKETVEFKRKDNSSVWISLGGSIFNKKENESLWVVADISDQLSLLEAEKKNVAKSMFLATMSHEIRTSMNGVIGCVEMLAQYSLNSHQKELVETMHESSFTLLRLIDDILDFSKIEAEQLVLEHEPVCLVRLLESLCLVMKPIALQKQLKFDIFIDPLLPQFILSDSVRLSQILNNLLSNAIKFTSDNKGYGKISVYAEFAAESQLVIRVIDNGIGIAPELQAKLFRPFMQANSSTTRQYGGTGLGLAICKSLTDMFKGSLEIDSELGLGSAFTVTLPIEPVTTAVGSDVATLWGLHCLVIAKDMLKAQHLGAYLEYAGAHAEQFVDREMAEKKLAQLSSETTVVIMEETVEVACQWLDALALDPKPALVVVDSGNRQRPRQLNEGIAMLDGDCMTCSAFLKAVGISTNRLQEKPPEKLPERLTPLLTTPNKESAIEQGRMILIAEDNEINQKIIARQLALLGYAADITDNGRDAFHAWKQGDYALLLTDLHMPEMDGYELVRAIRNEESGAARLPIIAITANVIKETSKRCLTDDMDGYLSKPIVLDKLKFCLMKWLPEAGMGTTTAPASVTAQSAAIADAITLDTTVLSDLIGENPALIEEVLFIFCHSAKQMRVTLAECEWQAARNLAHELKSSSRSIGALILGECCEQIELAPSDDDGRMHKEFELALSDVLTEIDKMKGLLR